MTKSSVLACVCGHRCAHTQQASTDDLVIGVSYILGYGRCGEMEMDNIKYNERGQFNYPPFPRGAEKNIDKNEMEGKKRRLK